MLILIAIVPASFTVDMSKSPADISQDIVVMHTILNKIDSAELSKEERFELVKAKSFLVDFEGLIAKHATFETLTREQKFEIRKDLVLLGKATKKLLESKNSSISANSKEKLKQAASNVKSITEYAPGWVVLMISLSLGLGTLV